MVRACASGTVDPGSIPSSFKSIALELLFTLLPALRSTSRQIAEKKQASLLIVPKGKALNEFPHLRVVDRWTATPKRARYIPLIAFS